VFSWIGQKLVVWEADGQAWLPDQILRDIFAVAEDYRPIRIGVEKEGLEEFLLQPIRAEMTRRRSIIPVDAIPAPAGKLGFIRSLQPFFLSGQIEFVKEFPILFQQLLSFPTGRNDTANALAYALRMRPGLPVYENFGFKNVAEDLEGIRGTDFNLSVNATRQYLGAVLLQRRGGTNYVLRDWLAEGDPGAVLADIIADVRLATFGEPLNVFIPPAHFRGLDVIGLQAAGRRAKVRFGQGAEPVLGRSELRNLIERTVGNNPALLVSTRARWTLNGMAGGFARSVTRAGYIEEIADEGPYKVLIEGLESLIGVVVGVDDTPAKNYDYDPQGRKYLSARASHRHGSDVHATTGAFGSLLRQD
jgi:hypothetical protein